MCRDVPVEELCFAALFLASLSQGLVLFHRGLPLLRYDSLSVLRTLGPTRAQTLKETLQEVIPAKQEQLKRLVRPVPFGRCAWTHWAFRKQSTRRQSLAMSRSRTLLAACVD